DTLPIAKHFRVFNSRTRIVEENLHVQFSENKPNIARSGPNWLFDIDALTKSMNYKPVVAGNQSNGSAGTKACDNTSKARKETILGKDYILLPMWPADPLFSQSSKDSSDPRFKPSGEVEKKDAKDLGNEDSEVPCTEESRVNQEKDASVNSTNNINIVNAGGIKDNAVDENIVYGCADDPNMPELEDIVYSDDAEDVGAEADMNNLDTFMPVSPILTTRMHKDHPIEQIIRDLKLAPRTRRIIEIMIEHAMFKEPKKVYRNKKNERGIMIKNKARLVAQGYTQEEGINYDEIDVKSAFLYGKIEEEVYVYQLLGFENPDFPNRVYKVDNALYGLHPAPKACSRDDIIFGFTKKSLCTEFEKMMHKKFQMSSMGKLTFFLGLQVRQKEDGVFISQDEYVTEILKKFGFSDVKTASTPMETHKPLLKDADGEDVDEHLYRSMIGSLMYLTSLRPDIMFADSPFDLVAYTDSDYAGASLDRKSTTGGCQFLGCRLISWQCKKQNVVANSTTEAEYIAASNCYGQVLWIQNQLLGYGYNFMQTKIHIDNEGTICIMKNLVFHSKTKRIKIRHHFIRDSNKKKLIQMIKIHTYQNVADLLTKAFDVSRFQYLIACIGMFNL
ncbi:putative ribonuclease H-like domain-containing protein, partial [Tanacetum coccineum]